MDVLATLHTSIKWAVRFYVQQDEWGGARSSECTHTHTHARAPHANLTQFGQGGESTIQLVPHKLYSCTQSVFMHTNQAIGLKRTKTKTKQKQKQKTGTKLTAS